MLCLLVYGAGGSAKCSSSTGSDVMYGSGYGGGGLTGDSAVSVVLVR